MFDLKRFISILRTRNISSQRLKEKGIPSNGGNTLSAHAVAYPFSDPYRFYEAHFAFHVCCPVQILTVYRWMEKCSDKSRICRYFDKKDELSLLYRLCMSLPLKHNP